MSVVTFEGVVENGQIRLPPNTVLPEAQTVFVVVPNAEPTKVHRILSPRLVDRRDAAKFEHESVGKTLDRRREASSTELTRRVILRGRIE